MFFSLGLNAQVKLTVNTIPKKVNVKLDGVILGESPIINERISPGIHKFEIIKKGFAPLNYELVVNPAQAVHLDFFMNPIYSVKFKTEETGLVFEINDEHQWSEEFIRLNLEAGAHSLRVF
ncbi:MAG: PEGA domain-containing protein, partial [Candidatus Marinimicrobia bacterium]|nr:PEGA domain-containing protein [Candidatus Neomarinimicrobiota bacterium]